MKSSDIRKKFIKYFESRGHKVYPSSSLIPSDPSVLLTLAGMLQFKSIFLGEEKPKCKRATSIQKCIRTNDIENVGKTSRHHTFFEMLGNFSFGDYFKEGAIEFAWELLTKEFKLPKEKLVVAVYEKDNEAARIWSEKIGVAKDKIYRLDEENNFWAAGPTGPCGPCSEIYYDYGKEKGCGKPNCDPSCDCERWLEVWNLVFIEFDRDESGKLHPLPNKNIDTGMGLERISRLLQNVETNFDTDLFMPIIKKIRDLSSKKDLVESERILADHARALTYLLADGVLPSNEGRGYILRRITRRAILHGRRLGIKGAFLEKLVDVVINLGKGTYKELSSRSRIIKQTIKIEEESFEATLESGMDLLNDLLQKYKTQKNLPGEEVFKLHDTYGFPVEMTVELASEKGFKVDEEGFEKAMEAQRERARASGLKGATLKQKYYKAALDKYGKTEFVGYEKTECEAKVLGIMPDDNLVILDKTPFYPESGGQVGDTGILSFDKQECIVLGAYGEVGGIILHQVEKIAGIEPKKTKVKARIDFSRRASITAHHTATHLLQAVLRKVLGEDVHQAGSLVAPDRFRFDYTYPRALTETQIEEIEKIVNCCIADNLKVDKKVMSFDEAKKAGALALFGEKYGDKVRVVKVADVSMELCGGCHVDNTKQIGFFKVIKEEALQAGVRRIEALVSQPAKVYVVLRAKELRSQINELIRQQRVLQAKKKLIGGEERLTADIFEVDQTELDRIAEAVDNKDIVNVRKFLEHLQGRLEWTRERNQTLEKEISKLQEKETLSKADELVGNLKEVKGVKLLQAKLMDVPVKILRSLADKLLAKLGSGILMLSSEAKGRVTFLVVITEDLVAKGFNAGKFAKVLAQTTGGGGGGKANKAEAGGRDPSKIDEAFKKALELIEEM